MNARLTKYGRIGMLALLALAALAGLARRSAAMDNLTARVWQLTADTPIETQAVLVGHAALGHDSRIDPPPDAGPLFASTGKFTANRVRTDVLNSLPGYTSDGVEAQRPTGASLPMAGQLVQGLSGAVSLGGGEFLAISDNGFGRRLNSPDALLMVHRLQVDWPRGAIRRVATTFLRDPERRLPFLIQNENSAQRYLTGADLDPESLQIVDGEWWVGDEFGPYVLRFNADGVLLGLVESKVDGKTVRGPDHYQQSRLPDKPGPVSFEVARSGGFEAMALSPDRQHLYPMFEKPLWDTATQAEDSRFGRPFLRILELKVANRQYTGRQWKYRLEQADHLVSDMQMIDADTALVIERDDLSEGSGPACTAGRQQDCFSTPGGFKRIYKIDFRRTDAQGFVRKVAYVDLLNIANPRQLARVGPNEARFGMPLGGIEVMAMVDARHLVVANDNNFPYASGRQLGKVDDSEFVLLDVSALLQAR